MSATRNERNIAEYVGQYEAGILDGETLVVDILATLRHFADTHAVDFGNADRIARNHYRAERAEAVRGGGNNHA